MFNKKKARPEHLAALQSCLAEGELLSPHEIVKRSDLSLTATYGAIEALEKSEARGHTPEQDAKDAGTLT